MDKKTEFKPLVYICSPYAGDTEGNTQRARMYSRWAALRDTIPVTPHLMYPQILRDEVREERAIGIECGMTLLSLCDELWVFGEHISRGMAMEIEYAKKALIPVRFFALVPQEVSRNDG